MWDPFQREILSALGHEPLVRASPSLPDDPLLHAVLRAAGIPDARSEGDPDALTRVLSVLPPLPALRADAAAKRALWRRLRRLRSAS